MTTEVDVRLVPTPRPASDDQPDDSTGSDAAVLPALRAPTSTSDGVRSTRGGSLLPTTEIPRGPARRPERGDDPRPAPATPHGSRDPGTVAPRVERLGCAHLPAFSHVPPAGAGPGATAPLPPSVPGDPTGMAGTLDVRRACCMVALAAVEVLAGTRPLAQLARWVTPDVYDGLARRAALTVPRGGGRAPGPERGAQPTPTPAHRPSVRRVRAVPVGEHVVEASVVVAHAGRVRAVAVRLARTSGRWRASALVVG